MPRMGTCAECGEEMVMMNKLRLLCSACQAFRDLSYARRTQRCVECGTVFWPFRSSYRRCFDCTYPIRAASKRPPCPVCGEPNRLAPGVAACLKCVQSSAEQQAKYYATLKERHGRILPAAER